MKRAEEKNKLLELEERNKKLEERNKELEERNKELEAQLANMKPIPDETVIGYYMDSKDIKHDAFMGLSGQVYYKTASGSKVYKSSPTNAESVRKNLSSWHFFDGVIIKTEEDKVKANDKLIEEAKADKANQNRVAELEKELAALKGNANDDGNIRYQVDALRRVFDEFDKDHSGEIDTQDGIWYS